MSSAQGSPSPVAALCAQQPSDATLVMEILRPWVASRVNQADGGVNVHVADFYSVEPENLAGRFAATVSINGDRTWYFLTEVRAQSRGTRKIRGVLEGDGWWQGEAGAKDIVDPVVAGDRPIGSRKSFSFMRKTATGAEVRLGWLMVEFYLHEYDCHDGPGRRIDHVVLAKLYRSKSKRRRNPMEAAAATASSAGKNKAPYAIPAHQTPEASENPAGGAGAATAPLLVEAAAVTDKNLEHPPLLHNKTAHGRAAASRIKNPEMPASRIKNPERGNGAGSNEKAIEESSPERKKLALGKVADANVAAAPAQLHCPQCGYHIGALQVTVPAAG